MFLSQFTVFLKHNALFYGIVLFMVLYAMYYLVLQYTVQAYKSRYRSRPYYFKPFRIYSKQIIKNAPLKCETKFYSTANRITLVFNSLLVIIATIYIITVLI